MSIQNEALSKPRALADVATSEDKLFHDGYVKGVAEFIETCATPMTIAIQGSWGTGKTSLIKLIEAKLRAEEESTEGNNADAETYSKDIIGVATVDVWQQFGANPHANLFEVVVGEIISSLSGTDLETVKWMSEFSSAASQIVGEAVATRVADMAGPQEGSQDKSFFGSLVDWLTDTGNSKKSDNAEEVSISAADLEAFRNSITTTLKQIAEEAGKSENSRFVVFIDGLDLIGPEPAVDLMEKIKTALDCPRCVFVLSVDEKTVFDGARKKLGEKIDESQQKLYFDRLVQVPFHIPSSAYNFDKYVRDLLEDKQELAGEFSAVIDILLENPTLRCIKRCLNTMYLYQSVFGGAENVQDEDLSMLLAAVILQVESPRGFDVLATCVEDDEEHIAENLQAALEPLNLSDGVNWAMLPALWQSGEGNKVDAAKRSAFLSWVRKLR